MALEKKVNLGGRSIETVSAIYSQLGNAYFALRDFNKALEYHQYDLETAK
uniref:Tetratricopeptide repeat protein n=2 Tax=Ascarididae TaxID=6250 RepID=A0A914SJH1_PAREQ